MSTLSRPPIRHVWVSSIPRMLLTLHENQPLFLEVVRGGLFRKLNGHLLWDDCIVSASEVLQSAFYSWWKTVHFPLCSDYVWSISLKQEPEISASPPTPSHRGAICACGNSDASWALGIFVKEFEMPSFVLVWRNKAHLGFNGWQLVSSRRTCNGRNSV